jgi:hypothetical protein
VLTTLVLVLVVEVLLPQLLAEVVMLLEVEVAEVVLLL